MTEKGILLLFALNTLYFFYFFLSFSLFDRLFDEFTLNIVLFFISYSWVKKNCYLKKQWKS